MITHKQSQIALVASSLLVLLIIALLMRQGDGRLKQETTGHALAPCCMEQEAGLSVRWYLQCDPAAYHTDWQLLM
ncbi:hypothetical protein [Alkalimonas amylolytica]|uniref:Uncharacterized protein n=1 Tax=Alkalimonas amylolytica TaxID=152573 RepID=A0A1H4EIV3_ALKAM|nr:hypothetical protein [Alkalimonas amylolytica]SEA85004.1 hypothetical protein SAMN04488051_10769 [Alkalimonas amylolytica]